MDETRYPKGSTALLFIDPYNDFLAEEGKMWPALSEVAKSVDLHANLAQVRAAAREAGLPIFVLPHHRHKSTDFERRGSQNPRCMPRCGKPRKTIRKSIVANDNNYALAA
jgi:nicotinamidase-related amidase